MALKNTSVPKGKWVWLVGWLVGIDWVMSWPESAGQPLGLD